MSEETTVLNRDSVVTKSGGRGTGRGGSHGTQGDDDNTNNPVNDFERLARMLERIRDTLGILIRDEYEVLNPELRTQFVETWPQARHNLDRVIRRLRKEAADAQSDSYTPSRLQRQLVRAGMIGNMLIMKEKSMNHCLAPTERIVLQPAREKRNLLQRIKGKLSTVAKPAFKVMNSIFGSLLKAFPGLEVVKELKEQVEASYEVAGLPEESRG